MREKFPVDKATIFTNAIGILISKSIPIDSERLREICVNTFNSFEKQEIDTKVSVIDIEKFLTHRIVGDYIYQYSRQFRIDVIYLNRCYSIDYHRTKFDVGELD